MKSSLFSFIALLSMAGNFVAADGCACADNSYCASENPYRCADPDFAVAANVFVLLLIMLMIRENAN